MTTIVINDLVTNKDLDVKEMAQVSGGSFASARQPTPTFPIGNPSPVQGEGITILGEEKYGGSGGQW